MSAPSAWRWCLVAGLIAFACSWGFGQIPGLVACGDAGDLGPILAFEFARDAGDLARLFGVEPCRAALVAAQRTGLWLDALAFIPSYTAFLCLAAWATGHRWRGALIALLLLAALADEIEGMLLFGILRDLGAAPGLPALFWAVRLKFALLAVATGGIGWAMMDEGARRRGAITLAGAAVALPMPIALSKLWQRQQGDMMGLFTFSWTALLLVAAVAVFWPRLLAYRLPAPASPSA